MKKSPVQTILRIKLILIVVAILTSLPFYLPANSSPVKEVFAQEPGECVDGYVFNGYDEEGIPTWTDEQCGGSSDEPYEEPYVDPNQGGDDEEKNLEDSCFARDDDGYCLTEDDYNRISSDDENYCNWCVNDQGGYCEEGQPLGKQYCVYPEVQESCYLTGSYEGDNPEDSNQVCDVSLEVCPGDNYNYKFNNCRDKPSQEVVEVPDPCVGYSGCTKASYCVSTIGEDGSPQPTCVLYDPSLGQGYLTNPEDQDAQCKDDAANKEDRFYCDGPTCFEVSSSWNAEDEYCQATYVEPQTCPINCEGNKTDSGPYTNTTKVSEGCDEETKQVLITWSDGTTSKQVVPNQCGRDENGEVPLVPGQFKPLSDLSTDPRVTSEEKCKDIANPDRKEECLKKSLEELKSAAFANCSQYDEEGRANCTKKVEETFSSLLTPQTFSEENLKKELANNQDAICKATQPNEYYCDGPSCIQKSSGWDGNRCVEVYASTASDKCPASCRDNKDVSGKVLTKIDCSYFEDEAGKKQCDEQNAGIEEYQKKIDYAVYQAGLKDCAGLQQDVNKEKCYQENQKVLDVLKRYNALDCSYTESCPGGGYKACQGVYSEDGTCRYKENGAGCSKCQEKAPDVFSKEAYCSGEGKCENGPGAACINDKQCIKPYLSGSEEAGARCVYNEKTTDGKFKSCVGKIEKDADGFAKCKFDSEALSCSQATEKEPDLVANSVGKGDKQNKCSEEGKCLNGPGYVCTGDDECQKQVDALKERNKQFAGASCPKPKEEAGKVSLCYGVISAEGVCELKEDSECSGAVDKKDYNPDSDKAYCDNGICKDGPGKACKVDSQCYFSKAPTEGQECRQTQLCTDSEGKEGEQVCKGIGSGKICDLSQGGGSCSQCQPKGTVRLNKEATCDPSGACVGAPAISGCMSRSDCKQPAPVYTNVGSRQFVDPDGWIYEYIPKCEKQNRDFMESQSNYEEFQDDFNYSRAGGEYFANKFVKPKQEELVKCVTQAVPTGRRAQVATSLPVALNRIIDYNAAVKYTVAASNRFWRAEDDFQSGDNNDKAVQDASFALDLNLRTLLEKQQALGIKQGSDNDIAGKIITTIGDPKLFENELKRRADIDVQSADFSYNFGQAVKLGSEAERLGKLGSQISDGDLSRAQQNYSEAEEKARKNRDNLAQLGQKVEPLDENLGKLQEIVNGQGAYQYAREVNTQLANVARNSQSLEVIEAAAEGIKRTAKEFEDVAGSVSNVPRSKLADEMRLNAAQAVFAGNSNVLLGELIKPEDQRDGRTVVVANNNLARLVDETTAFSPQEGARLQNEANAIRPFAEAQRLASQTRNEAITAMVSANPIDPVQLDNVINSVNENAELNRQKIETAIQQTCALSDKRCDQLATSFKVDDVAALPQAITDKAVDDAQKASGLILEYNRLRPQIVNLQRAGNDAEFDNSPVLRRANEIVAELGKIDQNLGANVNRNYDADLNYGFRQRQNDSINDAVKLAADYYLNPNGQRLPEDKDYRILGANQTISSVVNSLPENDERRQIYGNYLESLKQIEASKNRMAENYTEAGRIAGEVEKGQYSTPREKEEALAGANELLAQARQEFGAQIQAISALPPAARVSVFEKITGEVNTFELTTGTAIKDRINESVVERQAKDSKANWEPWQQADQMTRGLACFTSPEYVVTNRELCSNTYSGAASLIAAIPGLPSATGRAIENGNTSSDFSVTAAAITSIPIIGNWAVENGWVKPNLSPSEKAQVALAEAERKGDYRAGLDAIGLSQKSFFFSSFDRDGPGVQRRIEDTAVKAGILSPDYQERIAKGEMTEKEKEAALNFNNWTDPQKKAFFGFMTISDPNPLKAFLENFPVLTQPFGAREREEVARQICYDKYSLICDFKPESPLTFTNSGSGLISDPSIAQKGLTFSGEEADKVDRLRKVLFPNFEPAPQKQFADYTQALGGCAFNNYQQVRSQSCRDFVKGKLGVDDETLKKLEQTYDAYAYTAEYAKGNTEVGQLAEKYRTELITAEQGATINNVVSVPLVIVTGGLSGGIVRVGINAIGADIFTDTPALIAASLRGAGKLAGAGIDVVKNFGRKGDSIVPAVITVSPADVIDPAGLTATTGTRSPALPARSQATDPALAAARQSAIDAQAEVDRFTTAYSPEELLDPRNAGRFAAVQAEAVQAEANLAAIQRTIEPPQVNNPSFTADESSIILRGLQDKQIQGYGYNGPLSPDTSINIKYKGRTETIKAGDFLESIIGETDIAAIPEAPKALQSEPAKVATQEPPPLKPRSADEIEVDVKVGLGRELSEGERVTLDAFTQAQNELERNQAEVAARMGAAYIPPTRESIAETASDITQKGGKIYDQAQSSIAKRELNDPDTRYTLEPVIKRGQNDLPESISFKENASSVKTGEEYKPRPTDFTESIKLKDDRNLGALVRENPTRSDETVRVYRGATSFDPDRIETPGLIRKGYATEEMIDDFFAGKIDLDNLTAKVPAELRQEYLDQIADLQRRNNITQQQAVIEFHTGCRSIDNERCSISPLLSSSKEPAIPSQFAQYFDQGDAFGPLPETGARAVLVLDIPKSRLINEGLPIGVGPEADIEIAIKGKIDPEWINGVVFTDKAPGGEYAYFKERLKIVEEGIAEAKVKPNSPVNPGPLESLAPSALDPAARVVEEAVADGLNGTANAARGAAGRLPEDAPVLGGVRNAIERAADQLESGARKLNPEPAAPVAPSAPKVPQVESKSGTNVGDDLASRIKERFKDQPEVRIGELDTTTLARSDQVLLTGDRDVVFRVSIARRGNYPPVVENVAVDASLRNKGVGRGLVEAWEESMQAKGYKYVGANNVSKDAEGFWRSLGYRPYSEGASNQNKLWVKPLTNESKEAVEAASKAVKGESDGLTRFLRLTDSTAKLEGTKVAEEIQLKFGQEAASWTEFGSTAGYKEIEEFLIQNGYTPSEATELVYQARRIANEAGEPPLRVSTTPPCPISQVPSSLAQANSSSKVLGISIDDCPTAVRLFDEVVSGPIQAGLRLADDATGGRVIPILNDVAERADPFIPWQVGWALDGLDRGRESVSEAVARVIPGRIEPYKQNTNVLNSWMGSVGRGEAPEGSYLFKMNSEGVLTTDGEGNNVIIKFARPEEGVGVRITEALIPQTYGDLPELTKAFKVINPAPVEVKRLPDSYVNGLIKLTDDRYREIDNLNIPTDIDPQIRQNIQSSLGSFKQAFPDRQVGLFSTEGSSAVIYVDKENPDILYKVFTRGRRRNVDDSFQRAYDAGYAEREAKKLMILSQEGVSPSIVEYIPINLTDEDRAILLQRGFNIRADEDDLLAKVQLPLSKRTSDTPIIVMQKVDIDPKGLSKISADPAKIRAELDRIAARLEKSRLYPYDTEFVVDQGGRLYLVDAGAMSPINPGSDIEIRIKNKEIPSIREAIEADFQGDLKAEILSQNNNSYLPSIDCNKKVAYLPATNPNSVVLGVSAEAIGAPCPFDSPEMIERRNSLQEEIDRRNYTTPLQVKNPPRPLIELRIDEDAAKRWVQGHPEPESRAVAQQIIDKTRIVNQSEFEGELQTLTRDLSQSLGKQDYVVIVRSSSGSNKWVTELALPFINNPPKEVVTMEKLISDPNIKKTNRFVIFDDAAYSGGQLSQLVMDLLREVIPPNEQFPWTNSVNKISKFLGLGRDLPKVEIDVVVPYTTEFGRQKILGRIKKEFEGSNIKVNIRTSQIIPTIDQVISPELVPVAKKMYGSKINEKALLIFDHKIGDDLSTLPFVYDGGVITRAKGGWIFEYIPFIEKQVEPYKRLDRLTESFDYIEQRMTDTGQAAFLARNIPEVGNRLADGIYTLRTNNGDFIALRNLNTNVSISSTKVNSAFNLSENTPYSQLREGDVIRVQFDQNNVVELRYSSGELIYNNNANSSITVKPQLKPGDIVLENSDIVVRSNGSVAGITTPIGLEERVLTGVLSPQGNISTDDVIKQLGLSAQTKLNLTGKYKLALVDEVSDRVVLLYKRYPDPADIDRFTRNAKQTLFQLENLNSLEGVDLPIGLLRDPEGNIIGEIRKFAGETLDTFLAKGGRLDPEAVDLLVRQQTANIQKTGYAHGDLFFLYPDSSTQIPVMNKNNILVSYDSEGKQVLKMIDYNGVGGKVSQSYPPISVTDPEWLKREPVLLKAGLDPYIAPDKSRLSRGINTPPCPISQAPSSLTQVNSNSNVLGVTAEVGGAPCPITRTASLASSFLPESISPTVIKAASSADKALPNIVSAPLDKVITSTLDFLERVYSPRHILYTGFSEEEIRQIPRTFERFFGSKVTVSEGSAQLYSLRGIATKIDYQNPEKLNEELYILLKANGAGSLPKVYAILEQNTLKGPITVGFRMDDLGIYSNFKEPSFLERIKNSFKNQFAEDKGLQKLSYGYQEWKQPGFDPVVRLNEAGPIIEIAGPTDMGYKIIDPLELDQKMYISNIAGIGCQTNVNVGPVNFIADSTRLPVKGGSLGAAFASCLQKETRSQTISEVKKALKDGGYFVYQQATLEDILEAEKAGFNIAKFQRNGGNSGFQYKEELFSVILQKRHEIKENILQRVWNSLKDKVLVGEDKPLIQNQRAIAPQYNDFTFA